MTLLSEKYIVGVPVPTRFLTALPARSVLGASVAIARASYDIDAYTDVGAQGLGLPVPDGLRRAAPRRRADYTAGRYCARSAMSQFQDTESRPFAVPDLSEDAPRWPDGLVGSISHARGQATAVVARASRVLSVGVDIERIMMPEMAREIETYVCPTERASLPAAIHERAKYVTAIFSAKESLFKCLYPLVGKRFWFDAASVVLTRDLSGQLRGFRASLTCDLPPFREGWNAWGKIRCVDGFVLSALVLKPQKAGGL